MTFRTERLQNDVANRMNPMDTKRRSHEYYRAALQTFRVSLRLRAPDGPG